MKKSVILLLAFTGIATVCQAQLKKERWINALQKHTLISEVQVKSDSTENIEKSNQSIMRVEQMRGGSQNSVTRQLTIKSINNTINLSLKLTRIAQKTPMFDIDTDSPFSSNPMEKMAMDTYLRNINQAVLIKLNDKGEVQNIKEPKLPIRGQWNAGLPQLNALMELSGIIQNLPQNDIKIWVDTLKTTDGSFINQYSPTVEKGNIIELNLKGQFISNKTSEVSKEKVESKMPANGEAITAVTSILSMTYEGEIKVDKITNIIKEMMLNVRKNSNFSVLGQMIPRQEQLTYQITNKVKN